MSNVIVVVARIFVTLFPFRSRFKKFQVTQSIVLCKIVSYWAAPSQYCLRGRDMVENIRRNSYGRRWEMYTHGNNFGSFSLIFPLYFQFVTTHFWCRLVTNMELMISIRVTIHRF
jgi:hypothetical protein